MTQKLFHIEGLSCQHCVARVKNALEGYAGVQNVEVSQNEGSVKLSADPMPGLPELNDLLENYGNYRLRNL
jgi:copper chaperone CopZ